MEQLGKIAERADDLKELGVQPVAVCPTLPETGRLNTLKQSLGIKYPLAVDAKLVLSEAIGCVDKNGDSGHGLVLVDKNGMPLFRFCSKHAVTDISRIIAECKGHLEQR